MTDDDGVDVLNRQIIDFPVSYPRINISLVSSGIMFLIASFLFAATFFAIVFALIGMGIIIIAVIYHNGAMDRYQVFLYDDERKREARRKRKQQS